MFKTYDALLKSDLLKGGPAYGTPKIKPWFGYLYLATFDTNNKIKIGITSNIFNRDDQLRREGIELKYVWSMPTNNEIESKVKKLMFLFTDRDSNDKGKTEIFNNVSFYTMIQVVRLVILFVYLDKGYVEQMSNRAVRAKEILNSVLNSLRINTIKYGTMLYTFKEIPNNTFIKGDEVTVVYPKGEKYEGTYHARIIEEKTGRRETAYFVEWLEKEPIEWSNTTVPAKWIRKDTDIGRTLDILKVLKKLNISMFEAVRTTPLLRLAMKELKF